MACMAQRGLGLTYDAGCGRAVALFGSVDGRPCKVYADHYHEEGSTEDRGASGKFWSVHLQCILLVWWIEPMLLDCHRAVWLCLQIWVVICRCEVMVQGRDGKTAPSSSLLVWHLCS
jgi:hypothetical protein